MFRAVIFQLVAASCLMVGAFVLVGERGAISAVLVAASIIIPNAFMAWRLSLQKEGLGVLGAMQFLIYEFLKVVLIAGLLWTAIALYPAMHWPSFVCALVVVLQAAFLAFWKKST